MEDGNDPLVIPVDQVDADQWAVAHENWGTASQVLDQGMEAFRAHRMAHVDGCPSPMCTDDQFIGGLLDLDASEARLVLHVAIHRLETLRLLHGIDVSKEGI